MGRLVAVGVTVQVELNILNPVKRYDYIHIHVKIQLHIIYLFPLNRLLINLTSSAFVIYNEQIPTEKTTYSLYQQIVSYLQEYKAALTDENVWVAVAGRLGKLLNIVSGKVLYAPAG